MIEIFLLEQLEAFARCGTLLAAAEELHLSQPALTRSMKKLEELIGVPLFERQKNKLTLNEAGRLAAEYAQRVLEQDRELVERVRAFDKKQRTVAIGACAPVPLEQIVSKATTLYHGMTISQEIQNDPRLLAGLETGEYSLVILHEEPTDEGLHYKKCGSEHLYISFPKTNPLANRSGIWLKELEGMSILLFSRIGFWYELCVEKIPHPRFLMQDDYHTFGELVMVSTLPVFSSDHFYDPASPEADPTRVTIPILDEGAKVTYYLVCASRDRRRFQTLFNQID